MLRKRLAAAASGIYSRVAVIGRATASFGDDPSRANGPEEMIAVNFLWRSQREVARNLRAVEENDDSLSSKIGSAVRESGGHSCNF